MRSLLVLAACLLLPACASANYGDGDASAHDSREGAYISAMGIAGFEKFDLVDSFHGSGSGNGTGGGGLRIGYRAKNNIAGELFLEDSRGFSLESPAGSTDVDFKSVGLDAKFFLADGGVQPYGLIGAGWTQLNFSDRSMFNPATGATLTVPYRNDALLGRAGLGVDFRVSRDVSFFLEGDYEYLFVTEMNDFNHIDVFAGITINF